MEWVLKCHFFSGDDWNDTPSCVSRSVEYYIFLKKFSGGLYETEIVLWLMDRTSVSFTVCSPQSRIDELMTNDKHEISCTHTCTDPVFKHLFSINNTQIMKLWLLWQVLSGKNPQPVGVVQDLKECARFFKRCGGANIGRRPGRIYCSLEAWSPWVALEHARSYHISSPLAVSRWRRSRELWWRESLKCSRKGGFDISKVSRLRKCSQNEK